MEIIITILAGAAILSLLVLVHELGHFWMAKRAGIKVEEFGMGLPPRIWGKKKGDTIYSINWIPFGGFVKMYGEDQADPKMAKSKVSFAGKTVRQRVLVIIAGVTMNFLLAFILLTVGFAVGMKPLVTPDDVPKLIADGGIVLESGLTVEGAPSDTVFQAGDVIYGVDGDPLDSFLLNEVMEAEELMSVQLWRNQARVQVEANSVDLKAVTFMNGSSFPRLMVRELDDSLWARAGVQVGDVILKVNDVEVFKYNDLVGKEAFNLTIYRDGETLGLKLPTPTVDGVLVSRVIAGSPAEKAGVLAGDVIELVDGLKFFSSELLVEKVREGEELPYVIKRGDEAIFVRMAPNEEKRIGVVLSDLNYLASDEGVQLAQVDLVSTVAEIKELKEPWYLAPVAGFQETVRLSGLTFEMILGVFGDLFKGNGVPEGVSGPIGIAQMTYGFVQEGFIAVLQFIAVLSLSLAVINILPIPALDGGRLLFVVIEVLIGRKVNQKLEGYIHGIGYLLLLALILLVTYHDIMRL